MKSYRKELHFNLPSRRGLVNITREVQQAINERGACALQRYEHNSKCFYQ